jgi:hypothetical protein
MMVIMEVIKFVSVVAALVAVEVTVSTIIVTIVFRYWKLRYRIN